MSSNRYGSRSPSGPNVPDQGRFPLRPRRRNVRQLTPQEQINDFWSKFTTETPGKATSVVPQKADGRKAGRGGQLGGASYEEAAAQCRAKVGRIVKECRSINQKYCDPHFDLERDLHYGIDDCLTCLQNVNESGSEDGVGKSRPGAVKRVTDIFDKPQFYIEGPTASDVRQGQQGNCWLMAALCTMGNKAGLIERVCVARDEAVGVYGFVFHRDGEWFSEVIDDKLYLKRPDYDSNEEREMIDDRMRVNSEEEYRKLYQSNSGALSFAQCEDANETWLPLLEKAYAKAHGDYDAMHGGFTGEGIEDLTGGVTSEISTTDILDKEHFWREEMLRVNESFLFGCSTGVWGQEREERDGIIAKHAYSVMRAVEMDGKRLVLLKNPWGSNEWKGPWSDGSREWTAAWIEKLDHRFGDDGTFWISYEDLLRKYQVFDRTRLFDASWQRAGIWTTMTVPWTPEYGASKFAFDLARRGPVVLVLSQLDDRYFRGLEGQYRYRLCFRLYRRAAAAGGGVKDSYVVRSQTGYRMTRSTSVELTLDAGSYVVLVKIDASRDEDVMPPEEVVRENVRDRREKLIRIGLAYGLAHSKGRLVVTAEEEKARRTAAAERRRHKDKMKLKKEIMQDRQLERMKRRHGLRMQRRMHEKREAKQATRAARQRQRVPAEEGVKEDPGNKARGSAVETTSEEPEPKSVGEDVPTEAPAGKDGRTENRDGQACSSESNEAVAGVETGEKTERTEESEGMKTEKMENTERTEKADEKPDESPVENPVENPDKNPDKKPEDEKAERTESKAEMSTRGRQRQSVGQWEATRSLSPEPETDSRSSLSSLSDMSDRELEMHFQIAQRKATQRILVYQLQPQSQPQLQPQLQPQPRPPLRRDDNDEKDPWNAVAVVGLRVYYQKVDGDGEMVKLWIDRPNPVERESDEYGSDEDDETDDERDENENEAGDSGRPAREQKDGLKGKNVLVLDLDDSLKDDTLAAIDSILSNS